MHSGRGRLDQDSPSRTTSELNRDELTCLREGDSKTIRYFVGKHILWMLNVALRILRNNEKAEDAVQNAFLNIFKGLNNFAERSALKTWMHRIVVNEALILLRKEKRLKEISIESLLPIFDDNKCRIEDRWQTFETPESILQQSQARGKMRQLIDQLPDQYRTILVLRDIEELSTREVSQLLELSETNVKVRLHRARAALKKLLEPLIRGQSL